MYQTNSELSEDNSDNDQLILIWLKALYSEDLYQNIENIKQFEKYVRLLSTEAIKSKSFYDFLKDLAQNPHQDFLKLYLEKLRQLRPLLKEHFNQNRFMHVIEVFCYNFNSDIRMQA